MQGVHCFQSWRLLHRYLCQSGSTAQPSSPVECVLAFFHFFVHNLHPAGIILRNQTCDDILPGCRCGHGGSRHNVRIMYTFARNVYTQCAMYIHNEHVVYIQRQMCIHNERRVYTHVVTLWQHVYLHYASQTQIVYKIRQMCIHATLSVYTHLSWHGQNAPAGERLAAQPHHVCGTARDHVYALDAEA
jgi:hypothetical protein